MTAQIGKRIRLARQNKGLTQEQLSEITELSISSISRMENGKVMPSLDTLLFIAKSLDVGIEDLLYDCFKNKQQVLSPTTKNIVALLEPLPETHKQFVFRMTQYLTKMIPKD